MTSRFGPSNKQNALYIPLCLGMSKNEILYRITFRHDHVQMFNICNIKMVLLCTVNYTVFKVKLYDAHFK